ncbi:MAG: hypothetical protein ABL983_09845 [Nitrospira sp.]
MHLASILVGLVTVAPTMLTIGLKVLSIMLEFLTVVTKHVFVLLEILTVRPVILCAAREVAVLIT